MKFKPVWTEYQVTYRKTENGRWSKKYFDTWKECKRYVRENARYWESFLVSENNGIPLDKIF